MRNLVQDGMTIQLVAPEDVKPGDLVNVGAIVGVAVRGAKQSEEVPVRLQGVFNNLPLTDAQSISAGTVVYYNPSTKMLTADDGSGANIRVGVYLNKSYVSGACVRLNGSF